MLHHVKDILLHGVSSCGQKERVFPSPFRTVPPSVWCPLTPSQQSPSCNVVKIAKPSFSLFLLYILLRVQGTTKPHASLRAISGPLCRLRPSPKPPSILQNIPPFRVPPILATDILIQQVTYMAISQ